MMHPKISVIVPVYNTAKYVKKCLQSLLDQKIEDMEVIIINDASTDDSLKVVKKIIRSDPRFIIIDKKENAGLEDARKSGIERATGTYLCHVDSDDWLPKNSLNALIDIATEHNADIVVGNMCRVFDRFGLIKKEGQKFCDTPTVIDRQTFMKKYYINFFGVNIFPASMCGRIYKASFVKSNPIIKLGFNLGEDLNYNIQIFPKAEKIVLIPDMVYCYRYGGMTSKFNSQLMPAGIKMYNIKQQIADSLKSAEYNMFINFELQHYLKTYIEMFLKFEAIQGSTVHKKQIAEMVNEPEFIKVREFYATRTVEGFELAFVNGDVDEMYRIVKSEYDKLKIKYKMKRILSNLLPK